jgi:aryl-alcohol dehydrogenase-like predicted oxidoreductase
VKNIAVIARVPFDEGTLTGNLTKETVFPAEDWRSTYFVPENLNSSVDHADALRPLIPAGMSMAEMAIRFILSNPDISTTIPGMRKSVTWSPIWAVVMEKDFLNSFYKN